MAALLRWLQCFRPANKDAPGQSLSRVTESVDETGQAADLVPTVRSSSRDASAKVGEAQEGRKNHSSHGAGELLTHQLDRDSRSEDGEPPNHGDAQDTPETPMTPSAAVGNRSFGFFDTLLIGLRQKGRGLRTGEYLDALETRDPASTFLRSSPVISEPSGSRRGSQEADTIEGNEQAARTLFIDRSRHGSGDFPPMPDLFQIEEDGVGGEPVLEKMAEEAIAKVENKPMDISKEEYEDALFDTYSSAFPGDSYMDALHGLWEGAEAQGLARPRESLNNEKSGCPFWRAKRPCPSEANCPLNHSEFDSPLWDIFLEQSERGILARKCALLRRELGSRGPKRQASGLPFRGRQHEVQKVKDKLITAIHRLKYAMVLRAEDAPVIAVSGPSGGGKTALLQNLADALGEQARGELATWRKGTGEATLVRQNRKEGLEDILEIQRLGALIATFVDYGDPGNRLDDLVDGHGNPAVSMGLRLALSRFVPGVSAAAAHSLLSQKELAWFTPSAVLRLSSFLTHRRCPELSASKLPHIELVLQDDVEKIASVLVGVSFNGGHYAKRMQESLDREWSVSGKECQNVLLPVSAGALVPFYDDVTPSSTNPYFIALEPLDLAAGLGSLQEELSRRGVNQALVDGLMEHRPFKILVARACRLPVLLDVVVQCLSRQDWVTELIACRGYREAAIEIEREMVNHVASQILGQADASWASCGRHLVHLALTGIPVGWEDELEREDGGQGVLLKELFRSGRYGQELIGDNKSRFTVKVAEIACLTMARKLPVLDVTYLQSCVDMEDLSGELLERLVRDSVTLRVNTLLDHYRKEALDVAVWQVFPGAVGSLDTLETRLRIVKMSREEAGEPLFAIPDVQTYNSTVQLKDGSTKAWKEGNFSLRLDIKRGKGKTGSAGHNAAIFDELQVYGQPSSGGEAPPVLVGVQVKGEDGSVSGDGLATWEQKADLALSDFAPNFSSVIKLWVTKATVQTSAVEYVTKKKGLLVIGRQTLGVLIPSIADSLVAYERE